LVNGHNCGDVGSEWKISKRLLSYMHGNGTIMGNYKIYEDHLLTCESRWNIGNSLENHRDISYTWWISFKKSSINGGLVRWEMLGEKINELNG
jgi:hypothetical protein